jgi:uracil-DNA glycosylase
MSLNEQDSRTAALRQKLEDLHTEMRACRRCIEAGYDITPSAISSGPVIAEIMLVGQAPGVTEPEAGRPFHGPAGRRLFAWLAEIGWDEETFRATQYMTAITKCYPGKGKGGRGDRVPSRAEQKLCAPFLERQLALVQPKVILPVGGLAIRRFLGKAKLVDVVGTVRQDMEGRWIVPLPHPSGANLWLNQAENQALVSKALNHIRRLDAGHAHKLSSSHPPSRM